MRPSLKHASRFGYEPPKCKTLERQLQHHVWVADMCSWRCPFGIPEGILIEVHWGKKSPCFYVKKRDSGASSDGSPSFAFLKCGSAKIAWGMAKDLAGW
jgi:hypothetical protein